MLAQADGNRQWQRKSGTFPGRGAPKRKIERIACRAGKKERERARVVKGTRTNRHRFQWGKIEENVRGNKSVGIRAELKAGKTRSGYITACKCGERGCDRAHVDRNKKIGNTFAEYRKGGS